MKWWEESWYAQTHEIPTLHKIHCPVCKEYLGDRREGQLFEGHCTECAATFTFSPADDIPSVVMDCTKRKACHCMSCRKDEPEPVSSAPYYILPDEDGNFDEP
jgi:hypothetical protein